MFRKIKVDLAFMVCSKHIRTLMLSTFLRTCLRLFFGTNVGGTHRRRHQSQTREDIPQPLPSTPPVPRVGVEHDDTPAHSLRKPKRTLYTRRKALRKRAKGRVPAPLRRTEERHCYSHSNPTQRQPSEFAELEAILARFDTPSARAHDSALAEFRYFLIPASRAFLRYLATRAREDLGAALSEAGRWRADVQAWVDTFEEGELGGGLFDEALRVGGDMPLLMRGGRRRRTGESGRVLENDVDPVPDEVMMV